MKKTWLAIVILGLVWVSSASAAMVLSSEEKHSAAGPPEPEECMHEDSVWRRVWMGTLEPGESFSATLTLCEHVAPTYGGPGGQGIMYQVGFADRQSVSLHIVFPDGTVKQAHDRSNEVDWGWLHGCVSPYVQEPNNVIRSTLPSGAYTVVLTNTGTRAISSKKPLTFMVEGNMADLAFQRGRCPEQDWNIGPII